MDHRLATELWSISALARFIGEHALSVGFPRPAKPGKAASAGRDYEYVRHGTVSILADIDLHSGHIVANVEDRHRSIEFIALLKQLDARYPQGGHHPCGAGQHSTHISKETMACCGSRPGRLEYVHTPKHGSWLNLIE